MELPLQTTDVCRRDPLHLAETASPDSVIRPVGRVQLFFPPMVFSRFQSRQTAMFPLGLGYIAAVLDRDGYDVSLVDCPSEGYQTSIDIGKDREVYGLSMAEIRQRILEYRPDAIGLSVLFSTLENRALMIARMAKEIDPDIVVVCGGPHVSAFYKRLIQDPAVDYCVTGEGERVVVDLFRSLNGNGAGLADVGAVCRRYQGRVHVQARRGWIENLDEVPFPARHLVDTSAYYKIGKVQGLRRDGEAGVRLEQMTTSRGCPFKCTYCGKNATWGKEYRTRSAENVLDEMEHLIETYGVNRVAFQDDNFTADMERAARIFDGIVERKLPITWEAHNGLGVNFLSPALLEKMKASGCVGFTIAVESSNDATLRRVKKPNYIKLAPPIVRKAKDLDIEIRGFFMIGFPGETLDEVMRTVEYARNLDLAVSAFALVTPLPGTQLYNECVAADMIDEATVDFEDYSFGAFELQLSKVSVAELKAIRKIEWLKTVLMDRRTGGLKAELNMKPQDVLDELANGIHLFPDQDVLRRLHHEAMIRYSPRLGKIPA
ncbi:MAG: cobalamin B12-binding domain-containing protein [Planctomycetes bacterium]|nr:cobalamin B12-binding domain-containing protein [Planctomycetota bacterium]